MLRPKLNRIWTSSNSSLRRDPGDAKYLQGWISEIPTFQVLNYLQYKVDTTLLAQAERGIFEWGSDVSYTLGSIVWDELDKKIYISTVGSPDKTKAPSTNLSQWSPSSIQIPRASYDAVLSAINAHISDVTSNPHKITAGMINAYNKAEIDAIVVQYRALVSAHASDKNNPHGVTALGIGAVPSTGGTYTGPVSFSGGLFFDAAKINKVSVSGGLFLQSGNNLLGINSTGVAVTGTTSSQSPIVTEQTFPTLKASQEPSYAVPMPSVNINFMGDLHVQVGSGHVDSTWDTSWTSDNRLQVPANISASGYNISYTGKSDTFNDVTIAVDLRQDSQAAGVFELYGIGFSGFRLFVRADGSVSLIATSVPRLVTPTAILSDKATHRIVAKKTSSAIYLYADGVLVASNTIANSSIPLSGGIVTIQTGGPGSHYSGCAVCNFRVWTQALSDLQISTL